MEWYQYLLTITIFVALGGLIVLGGFVYLFVYLISLNKKAKINEEAKGYYVKIIEALGGVSNIKDVSVNSSRLSVVLDSYDNVNQEKLEGLANDGVGMVKSSKKITLVIGEMASKYAESIKKELN